MSWDSYFEKTKANPPSAYLRQAITLFPSTHGKTALDLGSGGGRDSKLLLDSGFKVTAVDAAPMAVEYAPAGATFVRSSFEEFQFGRYDLINSSYSLPFIADSDFPAIWQQIVTALNPGGVFVGQLFGDRDHWNTADGRMNFHARPQVEKLINGLKIHMLKEEEGIRPTASGERKLWHIFHLIVQRKT